MYFTEIVENVVQTARSEVREVTNAFPVPGMNYLRR
jgi:hypothetical protein